jgi:alpha-amylase
VVEASSAQLIRMQRNGHLWRPGEIIPVTISKEFRFIEDDSINITYKLSITHQYPVHVRFGIETNFNFQAGHAHDRYVITNGNRPFDSFLDSVAEEREVSSVTLVDEYLDLAVSLTADRPASHWRLPIYTISQSEEGFEKVFQGTTLVTLYDLTLTTEPIELRFTLFAGRKNLLPSTVSASEFSSKR